MATDDFAHLRQLEDDLKVARKSYHILTGKLNHERIAQLEADVKKEKTKLVLQGHYIEDFEISS